MRRVLIETHGFRPRPAPRSDSFASVAVDATALAFLLAGIWSAAQAFWGL